MTLGAVIRGTGVLERTVCVLVVVIRGTGVLERTVCDVGCCDQGNRCAGENGV